MPRDDDVPSAGSSAVGEHGLPIGTRRLCCEPVGAGLLVELADRVAARSEEQARPAGGDVGSPGVECLVVGGAGVPDVDASLREVVLERGRVATPDAERRGSFFRVGEAVEFGEAGRRPQRTALLGQVAEDATRGDRGELLVVSDQADAAAPLEDTVDHGRELLGSDHPRLVDDDERPRPDRRESRHPAVARGSRRAVEELRDGLGRCAERLTELVRCDRGGCEPDDLPATAAPGLREGGHRGGLAATGGCQGDLHASPACGESTDQLGLPAVESSSRLSAPVDGQLDEELGDDVPVGPFTRLQEAALGVEDRGRGVRPAPVDGVDRCAVRSAEELGLAKVGDDPHRQGQTLRHPVDDVPDCARRGTRAGCRRT